MSIRVPLPTDFDAAAAGHGAHELAAVARAPADLLQAWRKPRPDSTSAPAVCLSGPCSRRSWMRPFCILADVYVGATADVSIDGSGGGDVPVGNAVQFVALRPFSIEGTAGLNLAVGVSSLELLCR